MMISYSRILGMFFVAQMMLYNSFVFSQLEDLSPYMGYATGHAPDKSHVDAEESLTLLHINKLSSLEDFSFFIENILDTNADVVCFSLPFSEETSSALYQNLKYSYAHFYQVDPLFTPANLLVISKYELKDFSFTTAAENTDTNSLGFFDFVISSNYTNLGRVYLPSSKDFKHAVEKIQLDPLQALPLFSSEGLSFPGIETILLDKQKTPEWLFTRAKLTITSHEDVYGSYSYSIQGIICKNDSNEKETERSYGSYGLSGNKDFEGNTFIRGNVEYVWENDKKGNFSVGINGGMIHNDQNGTSGNVGVELTGTWR